MAERIVMLESQKAAKKLRKGRIRVDRSNGGSGSALIHTGESQAMNGL
jgi:hypothetical protein